MVKELTFPQAKKFSWHLFPSCKILRLGVRTTSPVPQPPRLGLVKVQVTQSCRTRCEPINYTVHGILQARILEWVTFSLEDFQGNLPSPGIEPRSPTLQVDSLPAEPQGKPKNTGMGSLSFPSGGFSRPRNQTRVSCIAGRFFTS